MATAIHYLRFCPVFFEPVFWKAFLVTLLIITPGIKFRAWKYPQTNCMNVINTFPKYRRENFSEWRDMLKYFRNRIVTENPHRKSWPKILTGILDRFLTWVMAPLTLGVRGRGGMIRPFFRSKNVKIDFFKTAQNHSKWHENTLLSHS